MHTPPPALKVTQTLVGMLFLGLVAASIAMTVLPRRVGQTDPSFLYVLLGAGGAILVVGQVAAIFIGRAHVAKAANSVRGEKDADGRAAACVPYFNVATILRAALAEGPGLLGAVTVMMTGSLYGLALAGAAAVVLAATFPTADRFNRFVEEASGVRTF